MSAATASSYDPAAFGGAGPIAGPAGAGTPDASLAQFAEWSRHSARFGELQSAYQRDLGRLWAAMLMREQGAPYEPVVKPDPGDRRFAAAEWRDNPYYDYLKQQYLLTARYLRDVVEAAEVPPKTKERLRFYARQYIDAMSPANFAATNPEAIRTALASQGESLAIGIRNLIGDVEKGRISTTDEQAFAVGRNVAATPGTVIFENDLIQIIQYRPATERVRARPLLMIPPCINKYYILDLSPENSFVRYAVEQGNTVFMVSWRNVTEECGHFAWDDYLEFGVFKAIDVACAISKAPKINLLGFCVGGTMVGAALTVMAARGDDRIESVSLLTTMLDFAYVGDIGVFVDEASIAQAEREIGRGGVKPGRDLAAVFSALRANDLVWSYVVNNYLKGRSPEAFDILYWNADSTNLAGPMYTWYVRNMYLENRLVVPDALEMCGTKVDLSRVRVPAYVLASREDHIVPWTSAYRTTQLLRGDMRFVLGASGHIAGVINPAAKNRRSYWTNDRLLESADDWLGGAQENAGSWWPDWDRWLARFAGGDKPAPKRPGNARFKPIEDAPGRYVKLRVV